MENLILAIALYVVFIAAANAPKNNRTTTEPINYFPEPEPMAIAVDFPTETWKTSPSTEPTEPMEIPIAPTTEPTPEPEPAEVEVTETKPAKPTATVKPTLSTLIKEEFTKPLEDLTIRELYTAAANAKIKGYKKLNKSQLIEALAA